MTESNHNLEARLESVGAKAGQGLQKAAGRQGFADGILNSLAWFTLLPAVILVIQLTRYLSGVDAAFLHMGWVIAAAILLPCLAGYFLSRHRSAARVESAQGLQAVDRQLGLADRLTSAQDLLKNKVTGGFALAAIEDGEQRLGQAEKFELQTPKVAFGGAGRGALWVIGGATLMLLAAQVGLWKHAQRQSEDPQDWIGKKGAAVQANDEEPNLLPEPDPDPQTEEPAQETANPMGQGAEAQPSKPSPDLSDEVKESSGKSGEGQSAGAQSTSAASQSRSSPSSQGQSSKSDKPAKKKPKKKKRKPTEPTDEPEKKPDQEEEAGSTAGRGSSKGSNKNPTTSSWKSKDQVTSEDDQEIEDDEESEDDEEEQDNRGGVQPHMRDRRPPVSRDLQIGFGNRSNPDANGRGGPSEQKKSRGVASLVLGVPIPDRIKGQPGPGPTKVTQERVEPQPEAPDPLTAQSRTQRSKPIGPLQPLDVRPSMRGMLKAYFLARRASAQRP